MKKEIILILFILLLLFLIVIAIIIKREKDFQNISTKTTEQILLEKTEETLTNQRNNNNIDIPDHNNADTLISKNTETEVSKTEHQQASKSENYSGNESFRTEQFYYELVAYDNYAYVSTSTNKKPDLLLQGDIITRINDYNFNGLPQEKIDEILDEAIAECEKFFYVKRNNEDLIVHTGNAQCNSDINYDIKYIIYDNYIYVFQSNNIYYDRLLNGDIIIAADNYDFQGRSAKEIHDIWESLKNKQEVYYKVKRGNEILTIVKGI